ncbi:MAG: energy-coupling factor transporter transmembrane component T [Chloroflexia bacterium]
MLAARGVDEAVTAYERAVAPAGVDTRRIGWGGFLRLAMVLAGFSAVFNALAAHAGETVLARLPADWPIIGGALTLEGVVYGALGGIAVVALLMTAGTFNTAADTYALLRSIPPALSQAGLVTAIGLAYLPQTIVRVGEIREAQELRGHRFRGAGSMLPLAVPLLAGGLERAIQLAEAMESRGFSGKTPERGGSAIRALLTLGTAGVGLGAFGMLYFREEPAWGGALLVVGVFAIGAALRRLGHTSRQTRYRHELRRRRDDLVSVALLLSLTVTLTVWVLRPVWWVYSPYPALGWPGFEPAAGLGLGLLVAPALPLLRIVKQSAISNQQSAKEVDKTRVGS